MYRERSKGQNSLYNVRDVSYISFFGSQNYQRPGVSHTFQQIIHNFSLYIINKYVRARTIKGLKKILLPFEIPYNVFSPEKIYPAFSMSAVH